MKLRKIEQFYPTHLEAPDYIGPDEITICKRCNCITDYCKIPAFHKSWAWLKVIKAETKCYNPNYPEFIGVVISIGPYEKQTRSHAALIRYEKPAGVTFSAVKNIAAFNFIQSGE